MAMGTVEGLLAAQPGQRTFVLSRAGSPGIQRYAANWLGDNCSRWEHLWMSIPMTLGYGVSGQPFVGADIGGFIENSEAELLVRWFQYGALTPFCRNHNCADQRDQYPWSYGATVEELCRRAIRLRYRLMPYIYAAFLHAAETGAPVARPLMFDFQHDRTTREIDDAYLFGDALLVAPVYKAGQHGAARSTCRRAPGFTGTRERNTRAAGTSWPPRRWTTSRSTRAAARWFRCGPTRRTRRWVTIRRRWS